MLRIYHFNVDSYATGACSSLDWSLFSSRIESRSGVNYLSITIKICLVLIMAKTSRVWRHTIYYNLRY